MVERIGFTFSDRPHPRDYGRISLLAEGLGYDSIWVTEPRLARDAITGMAVVAAATTRIRVGAAVVNNWTRGAPLMAATFASLDDLAPGRVILGLGGYWDPLAFKQGIVRSKHLTAMREYVDVVRRLWNLERVTFEGEIVKVRDLEMDQAHEAQLAYGNVYNEGRFDIPVYLGPTGDRMLELTGEIADGAVLNAAFSPAYVQHAVERVAVGAERAGRSLESVDLPKLIYVAVDRGPESWPAIKRKITRYLGQQPHVQKFSGLDAETIRDIADALGGWPPKPGGLEQAMELVPDATVRDLIAWGSVDECKARIAEFMAAGASWPILMTEQDDVEVLLEEFAPGNWK
jgi:5,10-methylenetetrahydromethanopterin reductase